MDRGVDVFARRALAGSGRRHSGCEKDSLVAMTNTRLARGDEVFQRESCDLSAKASE